MIRQFSECPPRRQRRASIVAALKERIGVPFALYVTTSTVVVLGICLGQNLLTPGQVHRRVPHDHWAMSFAAWDGQWYAEIAESGYAYDPGRPSRVAFFPLYPVTAGLLHRLAGLDTFLALLVVSNACLAATFVVAAAYVRQRHPDAPKALGDFVLLALGLFPPTLFFRMAYSESPFLLLTVLALYGMERRWPALPLGLVIGLATATRLTGLALIPAFLLYLWRGSSAWRRWATKAAWAAPLACWGIAAFMLYQWAEFGDPLAFVKAHSFWRVRPAASTGDKIVALLSLEPVSERFDPASPLFWKKTDSLVPVVLSYTAADVILFLTVGAALVAGGLLAWLSWQEWLTGAALLLIPYAGRAYEMCLTSAGRFAAVAFPVYLVFGHVFLRLRLSLSTTALVLWAVWLACFSAMFTTWRQVL
jgi:hypothetical protein